ncbi:hypothetical protein [Nisaea sp.]|uniref:hypothetical protein n=1 Tax=Nisaea sp. TaxID=2024842 RepID=UPI003296B634
MQNDKSGGQASAKGSPTAAATETGASSGRPAPAEGVQDHQRADDSSGAQNDLGSGQAGAAAPTTGGQGTAAERDNAASKANAIKVEADGLLSDCERSARYHAARCAFFDFWHRVLMVSVLFAGSGAALSAVLTLGSKDHILVGMGLFVAAVGAIDVVVGLPMKARDHEILKRRFYALAKRIVPHRATVVMIEEWRAEMVSIFEDEPATYHALNALCHNAICQSVGAPKGVYQRVGWLARLLCNWVQYSPSTFPTHLDAGRG